MGPTQNPVLRLYLGLYLAKAQAHFDCMYDELPSILVHRVL